MTIALYIYVYLLRFLYLFFKLFKTKDKVVFISRQSNKPSIDFQMLEKEIKKLNKNVKTVMLTKKVKKTLIEVIKNTIMTFRQMYHLATSKICIIDGYNISVSVLNHKKDLKVFQIWHSLSAIKKFGYQSLNTEKAKKIAKIMCMHKNYDYITTGSKEMTKYFKKAFNYSEKHFNEIGLPRIDYLIKNKNSFKKSIYKKYPEFKNKKVILYAPTFRDNNHYEIDNLINSIDFNKYILIIKAHPNTKTEIESPNVYTCDEFKSLELLSITNYLITDYSAITVEAAALDIPIYLYTYDEEEYSKNPGINLNLEKDLPGCVYSDSNDLYKALDKNKYNLDIIAKYKKKYLVNSDGTITNKLATFILKEGGLYEEN